MRASSNTTNQPKSTVELGYMTLGDSLVQNICEFLTFTMPTKYNVIKYVMSHTIIPPAFKILPAIWIQNFASYLAFKKLSKICQQ